MELKRTIAIFALALSSAITFAQTTVYGPISSQEINYSYIVGSPGGNFTTVQLALTSACSQFGGNGLVEIPQGATPSDGPTIGGVSSYTINGCANVTIKDTRGVAGASCYKFSNSTTYVSYGCVVGASGGGTTVTVNGGSSLSTANFNGTTPAAGAGFQNSTFQVSGANVSVENPLASSSVFGLAKVDNVTIAATAGVIAVTNAPTATSLAGGALGSLPFQFSSGVTHFIASPTTASTIFVPAWQPSGSPVAPTAFNLTSYLLANPTGIPAPVNGCNFRYQIVDTSGTNVPDTCPDTAGSPNNGTLGSPAPAIGTFGALFLGQVGAIDTITTPIQTIKTLVAHLCTWPRGQVNNINTTTSGIGAGPSFPGSGLPVLVSPNGGTGGSSFLLANNLGATNENVFQPALASSTFGGPLDQVQNQFGGCHVIGWSLEASGGDQVYIDGLPLVLTTVFNSDTAATTTGTYVIGYGPALGTNTFYRGWVDYIEGYPTALTALQQQTEAARLQAVVGIRPGYPIIPAYNDGVRTNTILTVGDSLVAGFTGSSPWTQAPYFAPVNTYNILNYGLGGQSAHQIAALFDQQESGGIVPSGRTIVMNEGGTNDSVLGYTAADTYSAINQLSQESKLTGALYTQTTIISRNTLDSWKNALDPLIINGMAELGLNAIVDMAEIPALGADGASANTNCFSDGTHLTGPGTTPNCANGQSGYSIYAQAYTDTVNYLDGSTVAQPAVAASYPYTMTYSTPVVTATTCASGSCAIVLPGCDHMDNMPFIVFNYGNAGTVTLAPPTSSYYSASGYLLNGSASTITIPSNSTMRVTELRGSMAAGGCSWTTSIGGSGGGSGTVTSVAQTVPTSLLSITGSPITAAGTLAIGLTNAAQNSVWAGPASGGAGAPSYQTAPTISAANMTSFPTLNQNTTGNAATATGSNSIIGGALGQVLYQTAPSTTGSTSAPTTSGHTFVLAWQPSGSAIAPAPLDLATYLASPAAIGGTTPAAGAFTTLSATTPVSVSSGGTGAGTFTIHGVLTGQTTGAFHATAAGATNAVFMGQGASADPIFVAQPVIDCTNCTNLPAGGNTTSTSLTTNTVPRANGANSIIDSAFTDNGTTGGFARAGGFAPTHLISADFNTCADTSGSGTAQVCNSVASFTPVVSCILYTTTTTNSGTGLTLNVNSFGAKSVAIPGASGWTTTLTASIIPANKPLNLCYDGTNWNVQQTGTSASGSGVTGSGVAFGPAYWNTTSTIAGLATPVTGTLWWLGTSSAPRASTTGDTAALGISGNAATATSLAGGATSQIPFQTGAGATGFSANLTWNNTNGQLVIGAATPVASISLVGGTTAAFGVNFGDTFVNWYRFSAGVLKSDANVDINGALLMTGTGSISGAGSVSSASYLTATNCASAASPAVCAAAPAGAIVIAAAATSVTVNTTKVTANSEIEITPDSSLGTRLGVTCNTSLATVIGPVVTARTAGTSFTVSITGTLVTNPACYTYTITN